MANRFEQAIDGLAVEIDGGVVRFTNRGGNVWLCTQRAWCDARRQLKAQPPLGSTDSPPELEAFKMLYGAIDSPILSVGGSDRGSEEDRAALATAALSADLLPPALAKLVPVRLDGCKVVDATTERDLGGRPTEELVIASRRIAPYGHVIGRRRKVDGAETWEVADVPYNLGDEIRAVYVVES